MQIRRREKIVSQSIENNQTENNMESNIINLFNENILRKPLKIILQKEILKM